MLVLVLSGLALASPAVADLTRYINAQTGVDDTVTHGTSADAPWRTVEFANRVLRQPNTTNGHIIVYLADYEPGYDVGPCPNNYAANGKRYFFIGNPSDPAKCVLPADTLYRAYVTLRGFKIVGSLTVDSTNFKINSEGVAPPGYGPAVDSLSKGQPRADSVVNCIMGSFSTVGAKYCTFVNLTLTGSGQKFGGSSLTFDAVTVSNVYSDITANYLGQNTGINYSLKFDHLDSCSFRRLKAKIRVDAQGAQQGAVSLFMVRNSTFNQCRFDIGKNATDYTYTWKMRNWSYGNHFIADTIIQNGPARGDICLLEKGGTNQNQIADNITSNSPAYFDSCLFYNANGFIGPNYDVGDWHFTYTTFVALENPAFSGFAGQFGDSLKFDHCTFATPAGQNTIDFDGSDNAWQSDLRLVFKNNIVAQFPYLGNTGTSGLVDCASSSPSGRDRRNSIYANNGVTARLDSVRGNVYWNLDYRTTVGDRTWYISGDCYGSGTSVVGASDPLTALRAGKDVVSKHAHPLFNMGPDTLINGLRGFDGRISTASPARGYGDGGTDAGAVAYVGQPSWLFVSALSDTATIDDATYAAQYTDTFTVKNDGTADLTATYTVQIGSAGTSILLDTTAVNLTAGGARRYTITYYTPGFDHPAGIYIDYVRFATNDPAQPVVVRPMIRTRGIFAIE